MSFGCKMKDQGSYRRGGVRRGSHQSQEENQSKVRDGMDGIRDWAYCLCANASLFFLRMVGNEPLEPSLHFI